MNGPWVTRSRESGNGTPASGVAGVARGQAGLEPAPDAWRPRFDAYAAAFEPMLGPQEGPPAGYKGDQPARLGAPEQTAVEPAVRSVLARSRTTLRATVPAMQGKGAGRARPCFVSERRRTSQSARREAQRRAGAGRQPRRRRARPSHPF